jgi:hypothetical protein
MSAKDHFIQVPLCALAIIDEPATVLNLMLSYGATRAGLSILAELPDDEREAINDGPGLPEGVAWLERVQKQGADKCGLTLGGGDCEGEYFRLQDYLKEWESRHGPDALVRVRTDICLEVAQGRGMSFREFRVLCAIYSAIGRSAYRRITQDTIRARASGCKSVAVMKAEVAAGRPLPKPLTTKQVRTTIVDLHERGWFARVTPDPHGRATYYSHRMEAEVLRERLFERSIYSHTFHEEQRRKNAELAARIQSAKAGLAAIPTNVAGQLVPAKGHVSGCGTAPAGHL